MEPRINITINSYNRAHSVSSAIDDALAQTYAHKTVTVIDDASSDNTFEIVKRYFDEPNFCYIRTTTNIGCGLTKNLGMVLSKGYEAITFHDSDDSANPNKVAEQAAVMFGNKIKADGTAISAHPDVYGNSYDVVNVMHRVIRKDGSSIVRGAPASLVSDISGIQFADVNDKKHILLNTGLYNRSVFAQMGGYEDVEEDDRELRNRLVLAHFNFYLIDKALHTKHITEDALTSDSEKGFNTPHREAVKEAIRQETRAMLHNIALPVVDFRKKYQKPIDLAKTTIDFISNPSLVTLNRDLPLTSETVEVLQASLDKLAV